jgi:Flp pilus assembly pilin Flp
VFLVEGVPMMIALKRLWRQESGQDAAEYALLIVGVALVVIAILYAFSGSTNHSFGAATNTMLSGSVSSGSGGGGSQGGGGGQGGGQTGGGSGGGGGQTGGGSGSGGGSGGGTGSGGGGGGDTGGGSGGGGNGGGTHNPPTTLGNGQ